MTKSLGIPIDQRVSLGGTLLSLLWILALLRDVLSFPHCFLSIQISSIYLYLAKSGKVRWRSGLGCESMRRKQSRRILSSNRSSELMFKESFLVLTVSKTKEIVFHSIKGKETFKSVISVQQCVEVVSSLDTFQISNNWSTVFWSSVQFWVPGHNCGLETQLQWQRRFCV